MVAGRFQPKQRELERRIYGCEFPMNDMMILPFFLLAC